ALESEFQRLRLGPKHQHSRIAGIMKKVHQTKWQLKNKALQRAGLPQLSLEKFSANEDPNSSPTRYLGERIRGSRSGDYWVIFTSNEANALGLADNRPVIHLDLHRIRPNGDRVYSARYTGDV